MNINPINRVGATNPYLKNQEIKAGGKHHAKPAQKDEIRISSEAKQLAASELARDEKIIGLKKAVANGTYRVDADKLAERMLSYFQSSELK